MENGFFFYRNDEAVEISCISVGFPLMWYGKQHFVQLISVFILLYFTAERYFLVVDIIVKMLKMAENRKILSHKPLPSSVSLSGTICTSMT